MCEVEYCSKKTVWYGEKDSIKPYRCRDHKLITDKVIGYGPCVCGTKATHGLELGKPLSCVKKQCLKDNYKYVASTRICLDNDCNTRSSQGINGYIFYCAKHKHLLEGTKGRYYKKCESCDKAPTYGIKGGGINAIRCADHKLKDDIICRNDMCKKCGKIQAGYGLNGKRTWCVKCAPKEAKNSVAYKCKCGKQASWGFNKPEFCKPCAPKGTWFIYKRKCNQCDKQASYGLDKNKPLNCREHSEPEFKNLISRFCKSDGCEHQAHFYKPGGKYKRSEYCISHAPNDYLSTNYSQCTSCKLWYGMRKEFTLCMYCRPDKRIKTRENKIVDYLKSLEYYQEFVHDKMSADNYAICGKYRPDILYNCGTHHVIIEVDEDQHKYYENNCELKRTYAIQEGLGLPCWFIRFNPDKFNGKDIFNKKEFAIRITKLRRYIKYCRNNIPDFEIKIKYLYYEDINRYS